MESEKERREGAQRMTSTYPKFSRTPKIRSSVADIVEEITRSRQNTMPHLKGDEISEPPVLGSITRRSLHHQRASIKRNSTLDAKLRRNALQRQRRLSSGHKPTDNTSKFTQNVRINTKLMSGTHLEQKSIKEMVKNRSGSDNFFPQLAEKFKNLENIEPNIDYQILKIRQHSDSRDQFLAELFKKRNELSIILNRNDTIRKQISKGKELYGEYVFAPKRKQLSDITMKSWENSFPLNLVTEEKIIKDPNAVSLDLSYQKLGLLKQQVCLNNN